MLSSTVMQVRIMRMGMDQFAMPVRVAMRAIIGMASHMLMLVVSVMAVQMLMRQRLMRMFMIVPLRQMQP